MLIINVNYIVFHMYSNNATPGYACVFLYRKWAHLSDVASFKEVLIKGRANQVIRRTRLLHEMIQD